MPSPRTAAQCYLSSMTSHRKTGYISRRRVSRLRRVDGETRAELITLLGARHAPIVAWLMVVADSMTSRARYHEELRGAEVQRVQKRAQQLLQAISALPLGAKGRFSHVFEEESRDIFPPELQKAEPEGLSDFGFFIFRYFDYFVSQLRFTASPALVPKRPVGRQREAAPNSICHLRRAGVPEYRMEAGEIRERPICQSLGCIVQVFRLFGSRQHVPHR